MFHALERVEQCLFYRTVPRARRNKFKSAARIYFKTSFQSKILYPAQVDSMVLPLKKPRKNPTVAVPKVFPTRKQMFQRPRAVAVSF